MQIWNAECVTLTHRLPKGSEGEAASMLMCELDCEWPVLFQDDSSPHWITGPF